MCQTPDYARNGAYEGWVIMPGMNIETLYELSVDAKQTGLESSYDLILPPLNFFNNIFKGETIDILFELSEAFDFENYALTTEIMITILKEGLYHTKNNETIENQYLIVKNLNLLYQDIADDDRLIFCAVYVSCITFWEEFLKKSIKRDEDKLANSGFQINKTNCIQLAYAIGILNDLIDFGY